MPPSAPSLQRQVARVQRRLFLQTLVGMLVRCWVAALLGAVVWFLAEPFVVRDALPGLRWYVLGGVVAVATLVAVALAAWRRPTQVVAALALDERFQLKERATTSMMLDARDAESPAALALLADIDRRVAPLYIRDRFPIKISWTAALVPVFALVVVLLAFLYKPDLTKAQANDQEENKNQQLAQGDETKKNLEKIVKNGTTRKVTDKEPSQAQQNIDKDLDKMMVKAFKTDNDIRNAEKEATAIEDEIKKREKELNDRQEAFKEQMKQEERLSKKEEKKDGPADKLDNALDKGDFDKAKDEAERLSKKLQEQDKAKKEEEMAKEDVERLKKKEKDNPNLTPEEREELKKEQEQAEERLAKAQKEQLTPEQKENLEEQLKDEQEKLERLTRTKEEKEQELKDKADKGEIDKEQLDRELEQLAKQEENEKNLSDEEKKDREQEKKDLQELSKKLGECQKCLKEGNDKEAGEKLQEAAKQMQKLDNKGEQKDLQQKMKELQEIKKELAKAGDGKNGKNNGRAPSGPNKGGQGEGQRDLAKDDPNTKHEEVKADSQKDKGQNTVIDHVPGQGFKGPLKASEMKEDIRRASQDAPEALDRQRLPRSASDMAKGYFDKMRGPEKTPEK